MDYGIDLGTTNSSIARMENGESVIKQTKNLMDTLPSCVYFAKNKKGECSLRIGMKAKDSMYSDFITALSRSEPTHEHGYIEFKREMGSDRHYANENMPKAFYTPEELSAEVLKELKSLINDEVVNSVVITVPAKFTAIQKDATMQAARMAGFRQCELLQEPIAACMAYGLSSEKKDGKWLVFDFGGGTFDAALVKAEDGILTVFDTEGDNYLGGKNLDENVINQILIPHLQKEYNLSSYETVEWKRKALLDALKGPAEEMRIALSFADSTDYSTYDRNINLGLDDNGDEIDLEITITKQELLNAIIDQYKKAVAICLELLKRNGLSGSDLSSLILIGGPTYSPIVREMLKKRDNAQRGYEHKPHDGCRPRRCALRFHHHCGYKRRGGKRGGCVWRGVPKGGLRIHLGGNVRVHQLCHRQGENRGRLPLGATRGAAASRWGVAKR